VKYVLDFIFPFKKLENRIPRKNTHDKENGFMHNVLALRIVRNIFGHYDLVESNLQGIRM